MTNSSPALRIRPYEARDKPDVARVFVDGSAAYQADFPVDHWDEFIQSSLDDDLATIEDRYLSKGGCFWVAIDSSDGQDEQVVGIVGLEAKGDGTAELRRMAVASSHRRCGVGRQLVAHLEQWAEAQGFTHVTLFNGGPRDDARAFYRAQGYRQVGTVVVSKEPHVEVFQLTKAFAERS